MVKRKRICRAVLFCMGIWFLGTVLFSAADCKAQEQAASEQASKEQNAEDLVTIQDSAALLMEEEIDWLKDTAEKLAEKSGWNIVIATNDRDLEKTARETCEDNFNTYTHSDDGISCLIDMANREIYLATAGEAIYYLNDNKIDAILDDAFEAVSEQDYAQCFYLMLLGADQAYESGIPDNAKVYDADTGKTEIRRELKPFEILWSAICAMAVGGIVIFIILGRYRLKWGAYQYDFHKFGFIHLNRREDRLVNKVVTHRKIPKNPDRNSGNRTAVRSSGSRNRSTVRTGSGGRRYGGGGRRF